MNIKKIYGDWGDIKETGIPHEDVLQKLWNRLAAHEGQPNFGLTQRKNEIIELWRLYRAQQPSVVLEIGTAQGGTFASWCQLGAKRAQIISIDRCVDDCRPRPGDPGNKHIYNGPLSMSSQGGGIYSLAQHSQEIVAISGWSYEEAVIERLKKVLGGRKIDFLFHDASHSAEMFAKDFEIYWPFVADGGIFASHDIMPSAHTDCNKSEAWEVIKNTADYSALYEWRGPRGCDSLGIGVLIK